MLPGIQLHSLITNQSFCGATPPQRLGWAEPRSDTWGFTLRGTPMGEFAERTADGGRGWQGRQPISGWYRRMGQAAMRIDGGTS